MGKRLKENTFFPKEAPRCTASESSEYITLVGSGKADKVVACGREGCEYESSHC